MQSFIFSKSIFSLMFLFLTFAMTSCAQTPSSTYKAENEGWLVDIDDAYAQSKKSGKPIMANFTGSDWCGWCKRLTAAVFSKPEFKTWAKKNVILLELDFPRGKTIPNEIRQQNAQLQQALGVRGYPTVWVMELSKESKSSEYKINALGKTGYVPTVQEFTTGVDQIIAQKKKG